MTRKETGIQPRRGGSEVWVRGDVYATARGPAQAEWRESGRWAWRPDPQETRIAGGTVF